MLVLASVIIIIAVICAKTFKLQKYWKEKNIRYVKPWPFFGYMAPNVFRQKSFASIIQHLYNTFPEQRYFGCYQFLTPILMIRDPNIIKEVMIKSFDVFPQHKNFIDAEVDPMWAKNLFVMKGGEDWREMRSLMSPMFTSSKLKNMFEFIKECAQAVSRHYQTDKQVLELDIKDIASRFANDVIASTVFGINCNSIENPDEEFYRISKEVTDVTPTKLFKFFLYTICPRIAKFLNFRILEVKHNNFYSKIINETMEKRIKEGIYRPDMIQLLIEARKHTLVRDTSFSLDHGFAAVSSKDDLTHIRRKEITDEDITAQAVIFFFAGFDTVSTAISHLFYELALNGHVQKKLIEEVDSLQEELTYERLLNMKYLDMVVSETLRKWPSNAIIDRECVGTFNLEPEHVWEGAVNLEPNTLCAVPIFAIHRDPKIYQNPNQFDPERFNDVNKLNIKPFTYLPFGVGPRSCIGSRFALLEIKTFVFIMISNFEIVKVSKTKEDLPLSKSTINLVYDKGFWIGLKPRKL